MSDSGKVNEGKRATRLRRYSANMEDYLEAVRTLSRTGEPVTVTRVSDALNVSKPSVTAAMGKLTAEGLVEHERYGALSLTPGGAAVAEDVCRRHQALRVFLTEILGVPLETAEADACKLEHHLSHDASMRLTLFISWVLDDVDGRPERLKEFLSSVDERRLGRGLHGDGGRRS